MVNSQRIMDEKTLHTLEYDKVLECLAGYCSFSASRELARAQKPTTHLEDARQHLAETREARQLIEAIPTVSIGGARDLREVLRAAARMVVLEPHQLLDVKYTLVAARNLRRTFEREGLDYPYLVELSLRLPDGLGLVDVITNALSDRGEILDSASDALGKIRRNLKIEHDRLMAQLQRMISNSNIAKYLQEALIMQRDGRYVLPVRADFKGRVKGIIHDQSASGATVFMEPLSIVEKNNAYRELQLAERDEERRILSELTALVAEHNDALEDMLIALAEIDLAFARAKYANALDAVEPKLLALTEGRERGHAARRTKHDASSRPPSPVIRLYQARHPLLDQESVVPIDVELAPQTRALVVTGPNTGGKTVTLKTVGLLALMAQSGMHIPAGSQSEISIFETIYADIGDEQSIEQSLSTFSGHITNI
ncbi:MAG: endonuclease MutS2, partial [Chloroflexi bacterium]|nr:endonuclease MutS2 [Chloroflexota bacterium]